MGHQFGRSVGAGRGGNLFMLAAFADHGQGLALLPKSMQLEWN
jgi:hypothetical protein